MNEDYHVKYAPPFFTAELDLPDADFDRVEQSVDVLAQHPGIALEYAPEYDHDLPPVGCKWHHVPNTTKSIYLTVDEEARTIYLLALIDERQDPRTRFSKIR